MATNQQRREAERRRLQAQLAERRAREAARKRTTLIASIIGTLVVIAVVVVILVLTVGGSDNKGKNSAADKQTASTSPSNTATTSAPPVTTPTAPCAKLKGATASFEGVTVTNPKDLQHKPVVKSSSTAAPTTLQCMDLVVGKGKAATSASTVSVQYLGALYSNGKEFNSSWRDNAGKAASFSIAPGQVINGFSQGIGGAGKVAPMRVGGRRIMILPAALAYGASPPSGSGIPANAVLVFIVDLKSVS